MSAKPAYPRLIVYPLGVRIDSYFHTSDGVSVEQIRQRVIDASETIRELWTLVRQQCRRRSLIHVFDYDFHRFLCRCMDSELLP